MYCNCTALAFTCDITRHVGTHIEYVAVEAKRSSWRHVVSAETNRAMAQPSSQRRVKRSEAAQRRSDAARSMIELDRLRSDQDSPCALAADRDRTHA